MPVIVIDFVALVIAVLFFVVFFFVSGWREKWFKDKPKSWENLLEKFLKEGD